MVFIKALAYYNCSNLQVIQTKKIIVAMGQIKHKKSLKDFPLPRNWKLKQTKGQKPVLFTPEGLAFSLDFSSKKNLSRRQPLVKAIGFKGRPLFVLDITAGWAHETFLISHLGCHVTAVESNPFVFHFVQESLAQKELKPYDLSFILGDSLNYLSYLEEANCPDVIYMDPMFGNNKKSLSKKSLRILKELVGETRDQQALLDLALQKAKKRVVVKRHHLESPLQKTSLCSFKGHSVCYDVFMPKKGISF